MWSMRLYSVENHLLKSHLPVKTPKIITEITLTVIFKPLKEHYCPTLQSKSWKEQQAQSSVDCLTTCYCQSSRWHKLSCPGYFWCSPFSQLHRALPASIPGVTPGHMHPRSHAHAWKRQDPSSISSWYSMAASLQKRRAWQSCRDSIWSRLTFQAARSQGREADP